MLLDIHLVKVAQRHIGIIRAEYLIQLLGRLLKDVLMRLALAVGLDVDLPQIFVQLGQRQLYGRLNDVCVQRRPLGSRRAARHGELIGKHEFHQLGQHAVLGAEYVLKCAV